MEENGESKPLSPSQSSTPYLPIAAASQTFGSIYFLVSTLVAAVIPAIELAIGLYYKGQCPIDQRIPTFLIVAGVCGLVLVVLGIFLALTFMCFIPDSNVLTMLASCGVCLNLIATFLIALFVIVWFIVGCAWVFGVRSRVRYEYDLKDPSQDSNYCNPVLYKWAFALLILTIFWGFFQCCLSCFRQCFTSRKV